jgi:hypothetical protein
MTTSPTALADIMNALVEHEAPGLPATALAEVFDRLVWCTRDNGAEIVAEQRRWLTGRDERRVAIALEMKEVLPFDDRATLVRALDSIRQQWPARAARCQRHLQDWDATMPRRDK